MDWLTRHPQVEAAARIGYTFGLDPIAVLTDSDDLKWMVRAAAFEVFTRDENARRKAESKGARHR